MTPLQAIRKHCIDCVGSKYATQDCGGDKLLFHGDKDNVCFFYKHRQGKGRPSVKLIRRFCLECQGGSRELVRECIQTDCPLHQYRLGTNPNRAKIGFKSAEQPRLSGEFWLKFKR